MFFTLQTKLILKTLQIFFEYLQITKLNKFISNLFNRIINKFQEGILTTILTIYTNTPITSRHSCTIISLKLKIFRITEYININGKK